MVVALVCLISSDDTCRQVDPPGRELWEAERDGDLQSSSGYGLLRSSVSASAPPVTGAAVPDVSSDSVGTSTTETDTGTDFGPPETFTKGTVRVKKQIKEQLLDYGCLSKINVSTQNLNSALSENDLK